MSLLQQGDPPPFTVVNGEGKAPVLMLCDHASKAVPQSLDQLGLSDWELSQHVGWDIGAAETAGHIARALDAPLVQSGYSRLVIDCNRRLDNPTSIPPISDKIAIPGNENLSVAERAERAEACFWPYHREVARRLDDFVQRGITPSIVIIHSFTPQMGGFKRPWHVGVLWDGDTMLYAFHCGTGFHRNAARKQALQGGYGRRENRTSGNIGHEGNLLRLRQE